MTGATLSDPLPRRPPTAPKACPPRHRLPLLPPLLVGILVVGTLVVGTLAAGSPAAALDYELQFVPAGPLVVSEGANGVNFQVQVVGGCTPYSVTWEPEIQHITTDPTDVGTPIPDPVGLSDIGPVVGIVIPINDDAVIEGDETFLFRLTPSSDVEMSCDTPAVQPTQFAYEIEVTITDNETFADHHLVVSDPQAVEGAGQILFEVKRVNADLSQAASATYQLVPGTAKDPSDYLDVPGNSISFPIGGPATQIVDVDLVDDQIQEPNEEFYLKITGVTNVAIGDGVGVGTILDDDTPPVLKIFDRTVDEGDTDRNISVEVFLDAANTPADPISVDYVIEADDATPGVDFAIDPGTLVFQPGETRKNLTVRILGDTLPETDETFRIRLQNPDGALLSRAEALITLRDDDEAAGPVVSMDDVSVAEGDEGTTGVTLTVRLDPPAAGPFALAFATEDGSAVAGVDYQAAEGVLEFAAGDTAATIDLTVFGDLEDEADETFRLVLRDVAAGSSPTTHSSAARSAAPSAARSAAPSTTTRSRSEPAEPGTGTRDPAPKLVGDTEAVITIVDDDGDTGGGDPPGVGVFDTQVVEGDEGTTRARFRVALTEPAEQTVRVVYATLDGTATEADDDYLGTTGQVVFDPGQREAVVDVPVVGDTRVEDDETFGLELTDADGAVIQRARATCVIRNDDEDDGGGDGPGPGGGLSAIRLLPTRPVTEGAGPAVVRVERLGSGTGPAQVLLGAGGGTATVGQDLPQVRRTVQWRAGQLGIVEVEIPILDDSRREDAEFFFVRIAEPRNARLASPSQVRQIIVDDDTPMDLVPVSETEQTVQVGAELTLEARVVRDDGEPVGGASVRWLSQRKVQITGDEVTFSGDDGLVRQTVRFAATPGVARVGAVLVGGDSALEFRFRVEGDLDGTIGDDDGDDGDIADAFDSGCADEDEGDAFGEACDYLYGLDDAAARRQALEGLSPRQALPHQRQALRAPRNQVRNVSARLTALRGGMARSAFDQFALSIQGEGLSLGPLQSAVAAQDPSLDAEAQIADRVDLALRRAAGLTPPRGGAASGDDPGDVGSGDDFDYGGESPWGLFFNGRVSFGDAPRLGDRPDFEFQTEGVTLGVDRRMGTKWVLGAALGYTQSETDVGADLGHLDLTGLSLSVYTTYYTEDWYVDGVFTYGENEYDVERVIRLPVAFRGSTRLTAVGSPDATQTAANVAFGYDFRLAEALTLSGFVRANWTRAEIDGYTETGALLFDLQYESQTLDSLLGEVGVEITRPFSFDWGVLQPLLRVAVLHEFDDDLDVVRARFARGRSPRTFRLEGSETDRDFFNVAVGATATLRRGWATYVQYDTDLERDDLDLYTFSGGFRFQF